MPAWHCIKLSYSQALRIITNGILKISRASRQAFGGQDGPCPEDALAASVEAATRAASIRRKARLLDGYSAFAARAVVFGRLIMAPTLTRVPVGHTAPNVPVRYATPESSHASRLELLKAAGLPPPARTSPPSRERHARRAPPRKAKISTHGLALIATRNFIPFAKLTVQTFLNSSPGVRSFCSPGRW